MKLWYLHYININKFYNNLAIFNIILKQVFPYSSQLIYIVKKIEKKKNSFYFFQVKNLTFKIWRSKLFRFLFFFFDTRGIKKRKRRREKHTTPHRIIYLLSKTGGSRFAYAHSERKGNKTFFLLLRNLLSRVEREAAPRGSIFHGWSQVGGKNGGNSLGQMTK